MLTIDRDQKGQPMIEWHQANGGWKRAWIQRRTDPGKDWAGARDGRYLNVVRIEGPKRGPAGNATDFPIYSDLPDEQVLMSFVYAISSVTGCKID